MRIDRNRIRRSITGQQLRSLVSGICVNCSRQRLAVSVVVALTVVTASSTVSARRPNNTAHVNRSVTASVSPAATPRLHDAFDKLALSFVENKGQLDPRVRYYAQGHRYAFYLTRDEVFLSFSKEQTASDLTLALRFVQKNAAATIDAAGLAPGEVNYLRGSDPAQWQTGLRRYNEVIYRDLWAGVDLRLREQSGVLKYEFRVHPGARPDCIRLAYAGADRLSLDASGALLIDTALGALHDAAPVTYQEIDGTRVPVSSRYVLDGARDAAPEFAFAVDGPYREDRDLVIDPGVQFTTFIGGSDDESANSIAVDASGNIYIAGTTQSSDFRTTVGAFQRTGAALAFSDVFVTKLNPTGTSLVYSTFVGGSDLDFGRRLAIDAAGNAYVTGQTKSSNFPTTGGAFDRSLAIPANCPRCAADNYDAFAFKLNATGSALVYSTYLGGTDIDDAYGIAVDGSGNAYIVGETASADYPTTAGAFSRTYHGNNDIFLSKLNATGSALVYSTFLGGTLVDNGERVAVDASGNAYVLGFSSSADYPTTPGAFDTTANGAFDVVLTKVNPAGSALVYSTYLGGQGFDSVGGLAVDAAGNVYISGGTSSVDFPTTPGAFDTLPDGNDAFLTKLNATGSALVYSTVISGKTGGGGASAVAVDAAGNAWITGTTSDTDFPVTVGAADLTFNGVSDVFISEISADGSTLLYSTYLGGSQSDNGIDITVDSAGNVYVAGKTTSMDFPVTTGAVDTQFNGNAGTFAGDAFVTKIAADAGTSTPPAPPAVPGAPTLLAPANGDTPAQPIGFDWNDVPSAASYTIQIANSNAFSAPLVREQTVTSSIYVTSGLATVTQFWRVRGINTAGVAGAWSAVGSFTPQAPPPPATLSTMSTQPSSVVGSNPSSGSVVLSVGAPFGGAVVGLSSSNAAVASVPASVTIPENGFAGSFTIATTAVSANTVVTITASYNGSTRTATLTVTPPSAPASLQAVSISPATVSSGSSAQGTVTLTSGAPAGGAVVSLSSSSPAATVPASVTVAAGATSAGFNVSTGSVSTSTGVTISATYGGATLTASLTVAPVAPAPPPPQTATLTVNASGRGGVTVTSTPAGISVVTGSSGSASFSIGTSIRLAASDGRSVFWSGACSSGSQKTNSCTFTINGAATVSANVQ